MIRLIDIRNALELLNVLKQVNALKLQDLLLLELALNSAAYRGRGCGRNELREKHI